MSDRVRPMDFEELESGAVSVVAVRGSLDLSSVDCLRQRLRDLAGRSRNIRLRLDEVTFADSSGLRVLVQTARTLGQAGGHLQIVAASAVVLKTIGLLHLDWILC